MARPAFYPLPEPSKSSYVAVRGADGEIVWSKMRIDRPLPCFLHPEYAAPETGACLHRACLSNALQPHKGGLLGNRLRILKAGWHLRGDDPADILDDLALELIARYRKIDVPVTHSVGNFLSAVEAVGVRHWGWACWEPDWEQGAGRTALADRLDDVERMLGQMVTDAFVRMADPLVHTPEQAVRNLQIAAAAVQIPQAVLGHILGELTSADLVRLKVKPATVEDWTQKLRCAYLGGADATI